MNLGMINIDQVPKWTVTEDKSEVFCVQLSPDGQFVASGLSTGIISLRSGATGRLSYSLLQSELQFPVTSLRFLPTDPKVLLAVSADGVIKEWSTKMTQAQWMSSETDNQIFALDIQSTGDLFATGGRDCKVRVYDYKEKKIIHELARNEFDLETTRGHCNRIYSIKFHPTDPNILFSGGWDDTLQVWDLRISSPIRALFGPHICGDSIDVAGDYIIACSWRTDEQIQVWDAKTYTQFQTLRWSPQPEDPQCLIYCAKFHPNGKNFLAGGSGVTQVRPFSVAAMAASGNPLQMPASVFSLCIAQNGASVVIGTGDGGIAHHSIITS